MELSRGAQCSVSTARCASSFRYATTYHSVLYSKITTRYTSLGETFSAKRRDLLTYGQSKIKRAAHELFNTYNFIVDDQCFELTRYAYILKNMRNENTV